MASPASNVNNDYFSNVNHSKNITNSYSWITDGSGNVYFGRSQSINQTSTSWDARYKFTRKERDAETGFVPIAFGIGASPDSCAGYDSDLCVWLSVDQLSHKYPSMSPYMYTAGNPVMLVDPDGREIIKTSTRYKTMKDGSERQLSRFSLRKADWIEINITVKSMKVIDLVVNMNKSRLKSYAEKTQAEITKYWNTSNRDDADENGYITNKRGQKLKVSTVFENDISVANDVTDIDRKDIVVANVDWKIVRRNGGSHAGMTLVGATGSNIILTQDGEEPCGDGRYAHEFGHVLGLDDVRIYSQGIENRRIMYNWAPTFGRGRASSLEIESTQSMPSYNEFKRTFQGLMSYHSINGI